MATAQEIYNRILAGKKITIALGGDSDADCLKQFEALRINLCKINRQNKALEITEKSVVARIDYKNKTGTFTLDWPARKQNEHKWDILDESEQP